MGGRSSQHLDVTLDESNYTDEWNTVVDDLKSKLLANNPLEGEFDDERCRRVLKKFGGMMIRAPLEGHDCGDEHCPHQGPISPLANMMLQSELGSCFKTKRSLKRSLTLTKKKR